MLKVCWLRAIAALCLVTFLSVPLVAEERVQRFDRDPGWESHNNRAIEPRPRTIRQDFGYSPSAHAGGAGGEIGGFLSPAAEAAYYAKVIPQATFDRPLFASGKLATDGRPLHALIGFFNSGTINEWRTPSSIALRISGRGDVFYAWVEYATARWRAGGDEPRGFAVRRNATTGRAEPVGFAAKGAVHRWSLQYDPEANGGDGAIRATIDDQTAVCHLQKGHKDDGAVFNRFGLINVIKSADAGGEIWLDDLTINGTLERFDRDPNWDSLQNRRTYVTANVRPRFDFGFSPTRFAGGEREGELGGLIFRGDCRFPDKMASYGDRLDELTLGKPLKASGRVCLRRGVTDSTVLIGFYHSKDSLSANPSQDSGLPLSVLGISVEGPSREGFFFAPAFRDRRGGHGDAPGESAPRIYPDGLSHAWSLEYMPTAPGQRARITVSLDGHHVTVESGRRPISPDTRFDRFGIVTTWIDGNGQSIYFDDLIYTCSQN